MQSHSESTALSSAAHESERVSMTWGYFFLKATQFLFGDRVHISDTLLRRYLQPPEAPAFIDTALHHELKMLRAVFNLFDEDGNGTISLSEFKTALQTIDGQFSDSDVRNLINNFDVNGDGSVDFEEFRSIMMRTQPTSEDIDTCVTEPVFTVHVPASSNACDGKEIAATCSLRRIIRRVMEHRWTLRVIMLAIVTNVALLSAEHVDQPDTFTSTVEALNTFLAVIFFMELIGNLVSFGISEFMVDGLNAFDATIVIIGVIEALSATKQLVILRLFRLLRIGKLLRYLPTIQRQLTVMIRTLSSVMGFMVLMFLFVFVFAILGMNIFAGRLPAEARINFDGFISSFIAVFVVLSTEDWDLIMSTAVEGTTVWASMYFIIVIVIGNYILFNLFVAIMVEGFATDPETVKHFKEAVLKARTVMKTISLASSVSNVMEHNTTSIASLPPPPAQQICHAPPSQHRWWQVLWRYRCWSACWRKWLSRPSNRVGPSGSRVIMHARDDGPARRRARPKVPCPALIPVLRHVAFERTVMIGIAFSVVTLSMERPSIKSDSMERHFLNTASWLLTIFFTVEMFIKMLASGLWTNPQAYLRSGWNRLDFLLVVSNWIHLGLSLGGVGTRAMGVFRIFRMLRVLRPLRAVQRVPQLRQTIETLILSVWPLTNVIFIGALFFIIFAVCGIQIFKGAFSYCEAPSSVGDGFVSAASILGQTNWSALTTRFTLAGFKTLDRPDCLAQGGIWKTFKYNFDDFPQALLTLFVMAAKDGWDDILVNGMSARGAGLAPGVYANQWAALYFTSFILVVGYFVMNMFVGVIVENFQLSMPLVDSSSKRAAAIGLEDNNAACGLEAMDGAAADHDLGPVVRLIKHRFFDHVISAAIFLNLVFICTEHYQQPVWLGRFLVMQERLFVFVYILEIVVKLGGLGLRRYWQDRWNRLDTVLLAVSVIGFLADVMNEFEVVQIETTLLNALRLLRLVRILRLMKVATGMRTLLATVAQSTGHVLHLGALLLLLFIISSALSIELFGRIECSIEYPCIELSDRLNFSNIGMAMLALFQIATGDEWAAILEDTLRRPPQCNASPECLTNCCSIPWVGTIFLVVFVVLVQLILLNVVVAVLMKNLTEAEPSLLGHDSFVETVTDDLNGVGRNVKTSERPTVHLIMNLMHMRMKKTEGYVSPRMSQQDPLSTLEKAEPSPPVPRTMPRMLPPLSHQNMRQLTPQQCISPRLSMTLKD